ncbi:MAG: phosphopantetheine-binding protein [Cyclobacteriaceae bacterium]
MNRDNVKEELMTIIKPFVPDGESIDLSDNQDLINDLKINSAHIVDIVLDIEDKFDINIEDDVIGEMNTVADAVDVVMKKTA